MNNYKIGANNRAALIREYILSKRREFCRKLAELEPLVDIITKIPLQNALLAYEKGNYSEKFAVAYALRESICNEDDFSLAIKLFETEREDLLRATLFSSVCAAAFLKRVIDIEQNAFLLKRFYAQAVKSEILTKDFALNAIAFTDLSWYVHDEAIRELIATLRASEYKDWRATAALALSRTLGEVSTGILIAAFEEELDPEVRLKFVEPLLFATRNSWKRQIVTDYLYEKVWQYREKESDVADKLELLLEIYGK